MLKNLVFTPSVMLAAAASVAPAKAQQAQFYDVGALNGFNSSYSTALSSDGSTVVGTSENGPLFQFQAFRWTADQGMVGLGYLNPDSVERWSRAATVSATGTAVAGHGTSADGTPNRVEAFRWTEQTGMVGLGYLSQLEGEKTSVANGISDDGSFVVGRSWNSDGIVTWDEAFRWSTEQGMIGLGYLNTHVSGYRFSFAVALASDGSTIVGTSSNSDGSNDWYEAFLWRETGGMVGLGYLGQTADGSRNSYANAISADGTTVAGSSLNSDGIRDWYEAFRWTEQDGMVGLGYLNEFAIGVGSSSALKVSANGSTIVGASSNSDGVAGWMEPFRWTASEGMVGLGRLSGATGDAGPTSMSADGSVIVGWSATSQIGDLADFRWSAESGMQSVADWIGPEVDLTGLFLGSKFGFTTGNTFVSADGKTVSGTLWHSGNMVTAYVARAGGLVTPDAAARSFGEIAALSSSLGSAADTSLGRGVETVRHLRCHDAEGSPSPYCAFGSIEAGGTVGSSDSEHLSGIGHIGISAQSEDGLRISASLGGSRQKSDLALGGSADVRRFEAGLQLAYVPSVGPQVALSALTSTISANVDRRYMNGAGTAVSSGDTDGWGVGARAFLGWTYATPLGHLTPYGSYSISQTHIDGWTENAGPFPAQFNDVTDRLQILRFGLEDEVQISQQISVWGDLAWTYRIGDDDRVSGQLVDLFEVDLPIRSGNASWLEATAGLRYAMAGATNVTASATLAAYPKGNSSVFGRLTYSKGF